MKYIKFLYLTGIFFCLFLLPKISLASSSGLVIDEFQISGETSYDEYIAIYNASDMALNLNGYKLIKRAKSTTNYGLYDFGDITIYPKQKFVVGHKNYTGVKDFTYSYSGSSNSIAANNAIYLLAPDKSIVDLVGYGVQSILRGRQ